MSHTSEPVVVLLTRGGREHIYVANTLGRRLNLHTVIVEAPVARGGIRRRIRHLTGKYTGGQAVERTILRTWRLVTRQRSRRDRSMRAVLGQDSDAFDQRQRIVVVNDLNDVRTAQLLDALRPDLVLVYGTGIIRDHILARPRLGALNMHTGMSPDYRGADCAFWPVHDGRFELIGSTVHECTSAVDGGAILARGRANLFPADGLDEIFARCVTIGADLYAASATQVIRAGRITGDPQPRGEGREFRASMRGIAAERRARRMLARGALSQHLAQTGPR